MPTFSISIGGSARSVLVKSFALQETANGVDTLTCDVISTGGIYRPSVNNVLEFFEGATKLFSGLVEAVSEGAQGGAGAFADLSMRIVSKSLDVYAQRRLVTITLAAGSLESQLNTLITEFSSYGTAMHASQSTGPTMPEIIFTSVRGDELLDQVCAIATAQGGGTGWAWRIDENNKLRLTATGELSAPFNVVESGGVAPYALGDITINETRNDLYANRIFVTVASGPATSTEIFTAADGVTAGGFITFSAKYPASQSLQDAYPNVLVIDGVVVGIIGFGSTQLGGDNWYWDYAATPPKLVFTVGSPYAFPTGAEEISITYAIGYPFTVQADDAAGQAAYGLWERTVTPPNALSLEAAQAYADGLLAAQSPTKKVVAYVTNESGVKPGMDQTVNVAKRNINATILVQEVSTTLTGASGSNAVQRRVTGVVSSVFQGTFRGVLDQWMRGGGVTGRSTGSISGSPTNFVPNAPVAELVGAGHPQGVVAAEVGRRYRDRISGFNYLKCGGGVTEWGWYRDTAHGGAGVYGGTVWSVTVMTNYTYQTINVLTAGGGPSAYGQGVSQPGFYTTDDGLYRIFQTSSVQWTLYGLMVDGKYTGSSFTPMMFEMDWDVVTRVRTGPALTAQQLYAGVFDTDPTTSTDTLSGKVITFRRSTTAGDTGWVGVVNDGSTQTVTAVVGAIAVDSYYTLRIRKVGGTAYFSVNDGAEVSVASNVPTTSGSSLPWYAHAIAITTPTPGLGDQRQFVFRTVQATVS